MRGTVEYVNQSKSEVVLSDGLAENGYKRFASMQTPAIREMGRFFIHRVDDVVRTRTADHGNSAI